MKVTTAETQFQSKELIESGKQGGFRKEEATTTAILHKEIAVHME